MATNPIWVTLITASLGGLLTLVGVMITQRQARLREDARWHRECEREQTRWTREDAARSEERTQQRLADSYLEVLRIVEREGQWIEASITNWKLAAEEAEVEPKPDARNWLPGFKRVKVPEPTVTDRATIAAHLAAFGSENVRTLYHAWRSTTTAIDAEEDALRWDADQNYPYPPSIRDLKDLQEVLQPAELAARQALADAVAEELGPPVMGKTDTSASGSAGRG